MRRPWAACRWSSSAKIGASSRHGWHHDAQKFRTTTFPRRLWRSTVPPPSSVGRVNPGAAGALPSFSSAATVVEFVRRPWAKMPTSASRMATATACRANLAPLGTASSVAVPRTALRSVRLARHLGVRPGVGTPWRPLPVDSLTHRTRRQRPVHGHAVAAITAAELTLCPRTGRPALIGVRVPALHDRPHVLLLAREPNSSRSPEPAQHEINLISIFAQHRVVRPGVPDARVHLPADDAESDAQAVPGGDPPVGRAGQDRRVDRPPAELDPRIDLGLPLVARHPAARHRLRGAHGVATGHPAGRASRGV